MKTNTSKYRAIVPNFFTIGNMLCGFSATIYAFNHDFLMSMWMIFAGAIFDSLDGKVARMLNTSSDFGVEYDSLSDVITFGAAPSFMVYNAFFADQLTPATLLSFLPLLFGSIRLARFNAELEGYDKEEFKGLPIPLGALTISSAVVFWIEVWPGRGEDMRIFISILVLVSLLMVSKVIYPTMPNFALKHARPTDRLIFFVITFGVIAVLIWREMVVFPILFVFVLSGLLIWLYNWLNDSRKSKNEI